jgi:hypothetical protein
VILKSSDKVRITARRKLVHSILLNPYIITGISGHFLLTRKEDHVEFEAIFLPKEWSRRMLPNVDTTHYLGVLTGPSLEGNGTTYSFSTLDGKVTETMHFDVLQDPAGASVNIVVSCEVKTGITDKLFGLDLKATPEHIISQHLKPSLQDVLSSFSGEEKRFPTSSSKTLKVKAEEALEVISREAKGIEVGVIEVNFPEVVFIAQVVRGEIGDVVAKGGGEILTGPEALRRLSSSSGEGKMMIREVQVKEILESMTGEILSLK